jgi:hypothetical protein
MFAIKGPTFRTVLAALCRHEAFFVVTGLKASNVILETNTTLTEESGNVLPTSSSFHCLFRHCLLRLYETRNADGIACVCL